MEVLVDNDKLLDLRADGIIISTPLGSTAYNYSSMGSMVLP